MKKPVFQGTVEQHQLDIIASYCGAISSEVWPDVVNLPNYQTMRPRIACVRRLRDKFALYNF